MNELAPTSQPPLTARIALNGPTWKLSLEVTVPRGPTRLRQLVPLARTLADGVADATAAALAEQGRPVSCGKGCAACCRQLVMISEVEAYGLRDAVEALPEPRRSQTRARFHEARQRLEQAGLVETLRHPEQWTPESYHPLALDYFRQGIACPFLEDEVCSIHPHRPLRCREFLVTSPAAHCADPANATVDVVEFPVRVARALARFHGPSPGPYRERYVPLVLALEWADDHPEEVGPRPGPELLQQLLDNLSDHPTAPADREPGETGEGTPTPGS
jgi:Fe-S-cluster containining protein